MSVRTIAGGHVALRRRNELHVTAIKQAGVCVDCGGSFHPVAMDFDHLPGEEKRYEIARMLSGTWSIKSIEKEIAKCELVCSNCHRVRTATRAGWKRGDAE
jgi:hypothetical protein